LRRIPQLDGLRGIAIGLVLLHHYIFQLHPAMPEWLSAVLFPIAEMGWSGVDLFFVLSGFLIGGILVDARASPNYYSTFYIRRGFRILPLYSLLIFLGFLLVELSAHGGAVLKGISLHPAPWLYYITFTQNFYFATHTDIISYMQITWSLAVEEQFYLTLPLLVRKVNEKRLLTVVVGMAVFFGVLRSVLYWKGYITPMQSYVLPFCRFDSLFIGVACALVVRKQSLYSWLQNHSRFLIGATIVFGCAFFAMDHHLWTKNLLLHTAGFSIISIFYACVMMLILVRPEGVLARALCYKPLMQLGIVSYCVYLIHGSILVLADQLMRLVLRPSDAELWLAIVLGAAMTTIAALASWHVFELRMIGLGHRFAYERNKTLKPVTSSG
jgi:peptidoglycan/LPS O-acetylase OafA/YrhL